MKEKGLSPSLFLAMKIGESRTFGGSNTSEEKEDSQEWSFSVDEFRKFVTEESPHTYPRGEENQV